MTPRINEIIPVDLWEGNADCNDHDFQLYVVGMHRIAEKTFNDAIIRFTDPGLAPKIIDGPNELYPQLPDDCENNRLKFMYTPAHIIDNSDIKFTVVTGADTYYSVTLFRGLENLFPQAEFHFFKAITKGAAGPDANDVIFRVVEKDAANNRKVVYFGDLSDIEP